MKKGTVVILHGWGLSAEKFRETKRTFESNGFVVYVPDLPGFGKSTPPDRAYHLSDYSEFLERYLSDNHIQKPIVIGHSFGGRVALCFTATHPDFVKQLILTGTPGFTPVPRMRLQLFIGLAKLGKYIFSLPLLSGMGQNVKNWYYYTVGAREYTRAQGYMKETFKNVVNERLDTYMDRISIPCLLAWGEKDSITPLGIARRMIQHIQGAELIVIPDTDHGVSYKEPKIFFMSVSRYLL